MLAAAERPAAAVRRPAGPSCLAWAGWRMDVPGRWRPVKIDGTWARGAMILGAGAEVVMQIKWWRPRRPGRFDPARWLRRRLRAVRATADDEARCPTPPGFGPVSRGLTRRRKAAPCPVWYGWAPAAALQIEAVVRPQNAAGRGAPWRALQSLHATPLGAPTTWALLDSVFVAPGGFVMDRHSLLLGDLSLRLAGPNHQRLMLRQVYPSALALERRTLADWLRYGPFRTRKRFGGGDGEPWTIERAGRRLAGLQRRGTKRYPFPLGGLAARQTVGAVVHDTDAGRLLLAEHDGPEVRDDTVVREAILAMNRPEEVA